MIKLGYNFDILGGKHLWIWIQGIKKIIKIVQEKLTCSAHNLDHVFRVYNLCLLLAKDEKDVDLEVLIPSALLHDIARVEESNDKTGKIDHAILGSIIAEDILKYLEYEEDKIEKIKHCILTHRFRNWKWT